ncbi:serine hydrolase [Streptomyces finlayi]|uniref:Serine hydrolase n=1 Tax=Streptomyces finlayi TaxID=67296 RepID=A0A7G7BN89_9ACTN|nr:serine hydrolase [Streptomyces finlayi]QNE76804.1 serine hydrolase [Streptomyces finlayi]
MTDVPGTTTSVRTAAEEELAEDSSALAGPCRWAMGLLTAPDLPTEEELAPSLVPGFLDKYPRGFAATLDEWRKLGPFTVKIYQPVAHKGWLVLTDPSGRDFSLTVIIDSTGLVRILHLQPDIFVPEIHDWADLDEALRIEGVTSSVLAVRIEEGRPLVLHEKDAHRALPTGSAYKLYLMRALVHAIDKGELDWDDEVVTRADLRSLPTGDMQELPDGTRVSVRETAHKMIAMSDNTAADLLADKVGREAVERTVVASGHHNPGLLRPFLSSREVFEIGWGAHGLRGDWAEGDDAARRELLRRVARPLTVRGSDLGETVHQLGLDWHMSAYDVFRVLEALVQDGARDASGTVDAILTAYPGILVDRAKWSKAVFKGGSCPGVMMFCWLLEDHRGTPHVLVLQQAADDQKLIGDGQLLRRLGAKVIESGLLEGEKDTAQ